MGGFKGGGSCFSRSVDKRTIKLCFIGIQIKEKFQYLIDNFGRTRLRAVNFVHAYDYGKL